MSVKYIRLDRSSNDHSVFCVQVHLNCFQLKFVLGCFVLLMFSCANGRIITASLVVSEGGSFSLRLESSEIPLGTCALRRYGDFIIIRNTSKQIND